MNSKAELTSISKFLSLVLRHEPQRIGIRLDEAGWTRVDDLLGGAEAAGRPISRDDLVEVVINSEKQRFALSDDGQMIRANQGHSVEVDLGLSEVQPPDFLFHGTASRFVESILGSGLNRRARHHVHLTAHRETAISVGQRYGVPIVLKVDAGGMAATGFKFWRTANGVWLVNEVPAAFIEVTS